MWPNSFLRFPARFRFHSQLLLVVVLGISGGQAALAHHSFAAEFDAKKPVQLQGSLTKLEWTNPHIWLYLDVKDASGAVVKWQCEGGAPNGLTRNGWTKDTIKVGDRVSIDGWAAKDGTNTCNAKAVRLSDGKEIFAGSSNPEGK